MSEKKPVCIDCEVKTEVVDEDDYPDRVNGKEFDLDDTNSEEVWECTECGEQYMGYIDKEPPEKDMAVYARVSDFGT